MTNKSTTFKRVALALVASLSFGVFGSGQATAVLNSATNSPGLTLSASTASAAPGETVSVTVTVNFTSTAIYESMNVVMNDVGNVTERFKGLTTDSQNVRTSASTSWHGNAALANPYLLLETANTFSVFASTRPDSVVAATSTGIYINSNENSTTPTPVQAKMTLELIVATNATAGVYTYAVTLRTISNGSITNYDSETLQLTVTAKNLTASAATSKLYVNQALCTLGACDGVRSGGAAYAIEADSTLTVSAGTVAAGSTQTFTAVGYMFGILNNSADTKTVTGDAVTGTLKVTLSGPGWLASVSDSTKRKSVDVTASTETITIYSDGNPGAATITGYIGTTALTQAAKTVTFTGKAATITTTDTSVVRLNAGASLSARAADSLTVGTKLLTFTAKDSAGNAITDLSMNANATLYCVSSDTSVIGTGTGASATAAHKAATALTSGVWGCDMVVRKAGTASVTIADESVVANSAVTSTASTFTFANAVNSTTKGIGTITFDKTSYVLGEQAVITVTVLNSDKTAPGMVKVDGDEYATTTVFPTLLQNKEFSSYVTGSGSLTYGFGSGRIGKVFDLTGSTFVRGVETYVVFMPTTTGKVTLTGFTTDGTNDTATAVSVSVDVVDPNAALINAATASADAATDAAAEAIDAANAATDAANLAAEAADAATVAAEEARDAADAATAAVEELATAVATLMAALKAQVTTLANTVAKIAKKVGVKKP